MSHPHKTTPKANTKKSCWVITEGIAGTENQCIGLAESLGLKPVIKRIKLNWLWRILTPYVRLCHQWAVSNNGDSISPPYPDIVIASGRKSIPAALHIKNQNPETFLVQIQDPRCNPALFDMVIVPEHDPTRGKNVITTIGSLNKVTQDKLDSASKQFEFLLSSTKKPRLAVLIGGNSKTHNLTRENTDKLCEQLITLSQDYGLMITASRRTGEENGALLKEKLSGKNNIYFWNGQGENPYFAFLGLADAILVTADSVSMISEALTTGKPTYIIPMEENRHGSRVNKFHQIIFEGGFARPFEGNIEIWEKKKLNETKRIAKMIETAMQNR